MQVEQAEVKVILQMSHTYTHMLMYMQLHSVNIFTSDHCECDTEDNNPVIVSAVHVVFQHSLCRLRIVLRARDHK